MSNRRSMVSIRWSAVLVLLALLTGLSLPALVAAQSDLDGRISSTRYVSADVDTGDVYAAQGMNDPVAIASLTKVFTFIEAIERAPLDTMITTTTDDYVDESATRMGFSAGVTYTLEDLLYGMMLPSGNDAAQAIARSLGAEPGDTAEQSVARFVGWMNERAANMGLTNTNFMNPSGWGVPNHYSSAHDVAAFVRFAMTYPLFVQVISTKSYTTSTTGFTVENNNKILGTDSELIGGKTGYDNDAGYCLIEVWQRGTARVVTVTLDGVAPDVWYADNSILADYGFRMKAAEKTTGDTAIYLDPESSKIEGMAIPDSEVGIDGRVVTPVPTTTPIVAMVTPTAASVPEVATGGSGGVSNVALIAIGVLLLGGVVVFFLTGSSGGKKPDTPQTAPSSKRTKAAAPRDTSDRGPRRPN